MKHGFFSKILGTVIDLLPEDQSNNMDQSDRIADINSNEEVDNDDD